MAEALEFQGGPTPSRSIMDRIRMPYEHDCGCTEKGTGAGRCILRGWPAQRLVEAGHALPNPFAQLLARSPQLCSDRTNAKQPNA